MTASMPAAKQREYETVLFDTKGHVAYIALNRPSVLNAMNAQLSIELNDAFSELDADPDLWVGIVSGAGRAFCSGADVRQRHIPAALESDSARQPRAEHVGLAQAVNWKPVIAAVHGYAVGGGYSLMQGC